MFTHIHADREFELLQSEMNHLGISLNFVSKKEHVPDIERFNRTINEPIRYTWSSIPFNKLSKLMVVHIIATDIVWLDAFTLLKSGTRLSNTKGLRQLVLDTVVDYKNFSRLQPVKYDQVHQEDGPQNTIDIDQTVGAIIIGPQYNLQRGYFFRLF